MLCMENWFRFIRMKSFDYIFHVIAIWAVRPFIAVLTSNPTVYIMVCPQTLAEICKNMGICDVFKAVDTGQNIYGFYCIVNDVIWSAVYEIIDTKRNLRGNLSNVIVIIVCADGHAPPGACHQHARWWLNPGPLYIRDWHLKSLTSRIDTLTHTEINWCNPLLRQRLRKHRLVNNRWTLPNLIQSSV